MQIKNMNKFKPTSGYVQKNNPFEVTSCGRRRNFMQSPLKKADVARTIGKGKNFNKANPTGTGAAAGGGMTQKGVDEYKRNNPGSNLKTAVTKPVSELTEKEKSRRKSFCARSRSWTGPRGKAARRRWNC